MARRAIAKATYDDYGLEIIATELEDGNWITNSFHVILKNDMAIYLGEAEYVPEDEQKYVGYYTLIEDDES